MMRLALQTKEKVIDILAPHMSQFGIGKDELNNRITVIYDENQFNHKEDEFVWLQKKDKISKTCEIYFDNTWCCDLNTDDSYYKFILKYFKGFLSGYESGKIRLNMELAKVMDEMEQAAKKQAKDELNKKIEDLPQSTPEEKLAKEIIKDIKKDKDNEASGNKCT